MRRNGATLVREAARRGGTHNVLGVGNGGATAAVFETWPSHFEPPVRHEVSPPRAVIVDLPAGIARSPIDRAADGIPLRVRAEGLVLDAKVPGTLAAWARTNRGDWLGKVHLRIPAGRGYLDTEQWIPASAITPANPQPST